MWGVQAPRANKFCHKLTDGTAQLQAAGSTAKHPLCALHQLYANQRWGWTVDRYGDPNGLPPPEALESWPNAKPPLPPSPMLTVPPLPSSAGKTESMR